MDENPIFFSSSHALHGHSASLHCTVSSLCSSHKHRTRWPCHKAGHAWEDVHFDIQSMKHTGLKFQSRHPRCWVANWVTPMIHDTSTHNSTVVKHESKMAKEMTIKQGRIPHHHQQQRRCNPQVYFHNGVFSLLAKKRFWAEMDWNKHSTVSFNEVNHDFYFPAIATIQWDSSTHFQCKMLVKWHPVALETRWALKMLHNAALELDFRRPFK